MPQYSSCGGVYLRLEAKRTELLSYGVAHAAGLEVCFSHLCQATRRKATQKHLVCQKICLPIAHLQVCSAIGTMTQQQV